MFNVYSAGFKDTVRDPTRITISGVKISHSIFSLSASNASNFLQALAKTNLNQAFTLSISQLKNQNAGGAQRHGSSQAWILSLYQCTICFLIPTWNSESGCGFQQWAGFDTFIGAQWRMNAGCEGEHVVIRCALVLTKWCIRLQPRGINISLNSITATANCHSWPPPEHTYYLCLTATKVNIGWSQPQFGLDYC